MEPLGSITAGLATLKKIRDTQAPFNILYSGKQAFILNRENQEILQEYLLTSDEYYTTVIMSNKVQFSCSDQVDSKQKKKSKFQRFIGLFKSSKQAPVEQEVHHAMEQDEDENEDDLKIDTIRIGERNDLVMERLYYQQ